MTPVPHTNPPDRPRTSASGQAAGAVSDSRFEFRPRFIDYADEERFHDEWGQSINPERVPVVESFEAVTAPENRLIMGWLGDLRGLRVLDLGCGAGEAATYFALQGARVTAVDLSPGMLEVTRRVARRYGVPVRCVHQNAERLDLPPRSFDVIYAANLLHHVQLDTCLREVGRLLTPEGRFASWDPLRHNPIINCYRRLAVKVRTADEVPLALHDLKLFRRYFRHVTHRCCWLASLWIFMKFFLIDRIDPSKERYWKKIITDAPKLERTYERLSAVDQVLLGMFPSLERMCWNLVVCAQGPRSESC